MKSSKEIRFFQKSFNIDPLTKKRKKNNGEITQYYLKNSHPAIVDSDTWECVQSEMERQKAYCKEHRSRNYHNSSEENPLSARIICGVCGRTYMQLQSKRVGEGEAGRKYWRCSSFQGEQGAAIEGRVFTPKPKALWSKDPDGIYARYRAKNRKLPEERQMLCTDIQVEAGLPEQAFVNAWNILIRERAHYTKVLSRTAKECDDMLIRYRAKEMLRLLNDGAETDNFDYALSLRVLDHIEVNEDGALTVVFLVGDFR